VATNEGGENAISVSVDPVTPGTKLEVAKIFKAFPSVEQTTPDKMVVKCQLSQSAGDVYLSTIPKLVRIRFLKFE
jgi:hypothetical protein